MSRVGARCRGFEPRRRARCPQRRKLGPPEFMEICLFSETTSRVVTTSDTTFAIHLTLQTPVIPAGSYVLSWSANYQQDTPITLNGDAQVRVQQDGVSVFEQNGNTGGQGVGASDPYNNFSEWQRVSLTQGVHFFDLGVRRNLGPPSGQVALGSSMLALWSVGP